MASTESGTIEKNCSYEVAIDTDIAMDENKSDEFAMKVLQSEICSTENKDDLEMIESEVVTNERGNNTEVTRNEVSVTDTDAMTRVTQNELETEDETYDVKVFENNGQLYGTNITIKIEKSNDVGGASNIHGTDNLTYSPESIDLPFPLLNITRQISYQYPAIINNKEICGGDEGDVTGNSTKRSTSMPDLSSRIVLFQRKCSCDCHCSSIVPCSSHDDVIANTLTGMPNLVLDIERMRPSPLYIPKKVPGGIQRYLSSQISKISQISSANGSSPTSSQAPPNYRSLFFSILKDEPPKYEDVTGKELSNGLVNIRRQNTWSSGRPPTLMSCVTGFAIFIGVVIITSMLFYIIDSHFHVFQTHGDQREHGKLVPPP